MSLLQNLLKSLQTNVQELESILATTENGTLPHLYEPKQYEPLDDEKSNPPWPAFSLIDKIRTDLRAMEATVTPTRQILLNNAFAASKSAAIAAAASLGVTDCIISLGGRANLEELASSLQVNEQKLGRILRLVACDWIYREVEPGVFVNTRHSLGLLKSTNAHYFLRLSATEGTIAAAGLYDNIINPATRDSFKPEDAPFCKTVSPSGQTFPQYLMEPENSRVLESVHKGVIPWLNKITRASLLEDFPWTSLGKARVVDVGCGPGDCAFDILQKAPELQWVFQDLPHMIEMLKGTIPHELSDKVEAGDISFQAQDYFEPNVSRGDIWFLRGIVREYDDPDAIKILRHIARAMKETKSSRMILNEVLCSSAAIVGDTDSMPVPSNHIPEHQSAFYETANLTTWNTHLLFGGKERSFADITSIIEAAGLTVTQFYKFRSFTVMIECGFAT